MSKNGDLTKNEIVYLGVYLARTLCKYCQFCFMAEAAKVQTWTWKCSTVMDFFGCILILSIKRIPNVWSVNQTFFKMALSSSFRFLTWDDNPFNYRWSQISRKRGNEFRNFLIGLCSFNNHHQSALIRDFLIIQLHSV